MPVAKSFALPVAEWKVMGDGAEAERSSRQRVTPILQPQCSVATRRCLQQADRLAPNLFPFPPTTAEVQIAGSPPASFALLFAIVLSCNYCFERVDGWVIVCKVYSLGLNGSACSALYCSIFRASKFFARWS